MEPVNDVVFSKRLKTPKGDTSLFEESAKHIQLVPPSENSSFKTLVPLITRLL